MRLRVLSPLIAAGMLHGCRAPAVAEPAAMEPTLAAALAEAVQGVDSPALQTVLRRHWEAYLERSPIEATKLGVHAYDDRVADRSPAAHAATVAREQVLLADAGAIDPAKLSARDRVTRQIFMEEMEVALAGEVCRFHQWSVSAADNPVAEWNLLPEIHHVRTVTDAEGLLNRYRQIPEVVDQTIANLRAGLAAGRVANAESVRRVLAMVEGQLASEPGGWALLAPAGVAHPDWPKEQADRFRRMLELRVLRDIRQAFARYAGVLRDELLPKARGADRVGVLHVPEGAACYASQIRRHTSLARTAGEIHQTGLAEIERIDGEIRALGEKLLGTADLAEILRRLRGDPQLHFASAAEVVAAAEAGLAAAKQAMPNYFGILPKADCVVRVVPSYEAPFTYVGYYRQPIPDGSKPGEYFVNTFEPTTRPRYEARVLAIHEAIPGHHLQNAISQELAAIPAFRKYAEQTVFVEGWALYSEHLAHEMGLYASDLDRMGGLSFAAWRASRLVVDTGVHALGWTREAAEQFLLEHTALSPANIRNEVDRYITWPGQALAYKTGELELLRLRREAEATLGPRFDIKRFHDAVLQGGSVPLTVLRGQVDAFVRGSTDARVR
jgi:uncharacterized protein (DUF885 family)